jgi:hypothetical protein
MTSDMEGEDMAIFARFSKRPSATLTGLSHQRDATSGANRPPEAHDAQHQVPANESQGDTGVLRTCDRTRQERQGADG